jgi:adenosylcobinamide-GDP ribazoletransferase
VNTWDGEPRVPGPVRLAVDGVRLALTTLTVAPLAPARVDRPVAAVSIAVTPLVGVLLGVGLAVVGLAARALGAPSLLCGVLVVLSGVLATRALHLDGLADTADALGSYRDRATALAIMKRPEVGAFGVIALVLVLLAQAVCAGAILARGWPAAFAGIVAATATGRTAIALGCRRGVPAARADGLGALVAGSTPVPVVIVNGVAIAVIGLWAAPGRPWQGPVAVALSLSVAVALLGHAVRRLGGITGDVLGAMCEVSSTVAYVLVAG